MHRNLISDSLSNVVITRSYIYWIHVLFMLNMVSYSEWVVSLFIGVRSTSEMIISERQHILYIIFHSWNGIESVWKRTNLFLLPTNLFTFAEVSSADNRWWECEHLTQWACLHIALWWCSNALCCCMVRYGNVVIMWVYLWLLAKSP